ncbi:hypothetical protein B0F90DRAFT_1671124 [Multifurca ochricompacta]|uniref:VWFA domain-containing protein n=1 Tax=Multifurca ochricompacta TaxID=376703 RepID=A0AAD4LWN3_9AGAM|nr:hypothetical protein B0F90DRAFT_1671124 [Multifurca ochricompacta]
MDLNPVNGKEYLQCTAPRVKDTFITLVQALLSPPRTSASEGDQVQALKSVPSPKDSSLPARGMYRLLDLITEQGSGGLGNLFFGLTMLTLIVPLVDKIVIAQESLQGFINALSPGAYSSITKVNFKLLDKTFLKPIGIYGSKEEIVKFLHEINAVDDATSQRLLTPENVYTATTAEPVLRSGLYAVRSFTPSSEEQVYVLYWPEDSTWNDQATSPVQRNRVTFMRYLTKLCDQLVCLLSTEHSQTIVWGDDDDGDCDNRDSDDDEVSTGSVDSDSDRFYHFEVAKTKEQQENVITRMGFTMNSSLLDSLPPPTGTRIDPNVLCPTLLHGEKVQGFMTAEFKPGKTIVKPFSLDHQTADQIRLRCGVDGDDVLCLSNAIDDKSLKTLMDLGFSTRFSKECKAWEQDIGQITQLSLATLAEREADFHAKIEEGYEAKSTSPADPEVVADRANDSLRDLRIYPRAAQMLHDGIHAARLDSGIGDPEFQFKKTRFYFLRDLLRSEDTKNLKTDEIEALVGTVLGSRDMQSTLSSLKNFGKDDKDGGAFQSLKVWIGKAFKRSEGELWKEASNHASKVSDSYFLLRYRATGTNDHLYNAVVDATTTACSCLAKLVEFLVSMISQQILSTQKEECNKQVQRASQSAKDKDLETLRSNFVRQIEDLSRERSTSRATLYIDNFEITRGHHYSPDSSSYSISGRHEFLPEEAIEYQVHLLHLHTDQRHKLQLDPSFVPTPVVNKRLSGSFHIPPGTLYHEDCRSSRWSFRYAHLLEGDRILLGLFNSRGNVAIFIERLSRIDKVIQSRSFARLLHGDKIGETGIFSFDESKRMLAFYASARMQLHIFVFDEEFKSLRGMGSAIDLAPFYNTGVSIIHACFVHGSEEILFVDSDAQARILSLTMLQPKPASLQLPQVPRAIYSSPDGSCVLVVQEENGVSSMRAYHWSTFGNSDGILITPDDFPVDLGAALLTSIVNRNTIHLIGLDLKSRCCRSLILDITCKATEFTFQEQRSNVSSRHGRQTLHNCLIDCHADVWARFPVVPAVKRNTITSSSDRRQKTLLYVTNDDLRPFSSRFSDLIRNFTKTSRKPTGDELSGISVSAQTFPSFMQQLNSALDWSVSRFRAGEWLADLLCLIPIHIAVTHENRFVPLKDGVLSAELEKSLLGAEVNRIVDSLSLGWYESIFQSYWASKPVKVVSSMGEQSVGKSFTLNHLVDTSFAGSAMRTTVALDFEAVGQSQSRTTGIHSLERSAQEDALLVLFNTAISNLVLFRNNFALNRDITGLFQSFQSSSSILDPASNPTLFQSTLVVIIKDVIDSDQAEVTREFSVKFQKIVEDEQDSNFITRLHAGKLKIVPWPVIESKEFYKLFLKVNKIIDKQPVSHQTAGSFLLTLKTLMAKLKLIAARFAGQANDWGAVLQTMAIHRADNLLAILPNALETGFSEIDPKQEPLKDFDTDLIIEAEDTEAQFLLAGPDTPVADRELRLASLRESWDKAHSRQHIDDTEWSFNLAEYLTHLVDLRVAHVDKWLGSNVERFPSGSASIDELRRMFDKAVIDLRAGIQLCKSQSVHTKAATIVWLAINASTIVPSANGMHSRQQFVAKPRAILETIYAEWAFIYAVNLAKIPEDEVVMTTVPLDRVEAAKRKIVQLFRDMSYSAYLTMSHSEIENTWTMSVEKENVLFPVNYATECAARATCMAWNHTRITFAAQCCRKEHSCSALCSGGICEIRTTPQSIEATFTGTHSVFQYTKYAQDAKRLPCAKIIKPGEVEHPGPHIHSDEPKPFHFCESRCENCGYLCTLPFGHPQQEHETSHGSMSKTKWAIDGPDGTSLELGGHKFSSNDEGGPMLCNMKLCISRKELFQGLEYPRIGSLMAFTGVEWVSKILILAKIRRILRSGPEHYVEEGGVNAQPSRCTQALFHAPMDGADAPSGIGYVSNDGHHFTCKNPIFMQPVHHVIFVIDSFWLARQAAISRNAHLHLGVDRRDAYSLIFFDNESTICLENDSTSSPDELLTAALQYGPSVGTNFSCALESTQKVMDSHWSRERAPVVIFLSDGEGMIKDETMYNICRSAVRQGMARIAQKVQESVPQNPFLPASANLLSSYTTALDTVKRLNTSELFGY